MSEQAVTGRPWHLWVVGILSVLFNSVGCLDFVMTNTKNTGYLEKANFSPEQIEYLYTFPTWAIIVWAIAVWSSMLGAILVLAKKRIACEVYILGLVTYVLAMIRQYGFTEFMELFPETHYQVATGVIFVLLLGQLVYARAMRSRSVLS